MNEQIQEIRYQVGEAWKGTYNAATSYGNAAVVQDPTGLSVYRSLKPGNAGHPLTDRSWWFCIIDLSNIKEESDRLHALDTEVTEHETARVAAEQQRVSRETARVNAENARIQAEQTRASQETERMQAEQTRVSQEQQRVSNEQSRVSNEQTRIGQEQQRVTKENTRVNAETQRQTREEDRVSAEQDRIENELTRQQNESARQQGEQQRNSQYATAEANRNTSYQTAEANRDSQFEAAETERDEKVDEKVADITTLQNQVAALETIVEGLETIAEGYVRVAGSSSPALSYKSYKYTQQGGFARDSAFNLFYPCLVGTPLTGGEAQIGKILFILKKTGFDDGTGNAVDIYGVHHAIDGSEGDVMICNVEPYHRIMGKYTIDGTEYDVFLVAREAFTFQGIEAEYVSMRGVSPDYCVSHADTDEVVRMHSVYNPDWAGSYQDPSGVVGKFIYDTDPETGEITETYDENETLLGGAGGCHTTNMSLYAGEQRAMNMNGDTTKTVPWMNETAASAEDWFALMLAEGGTFDAHNANLMGSGFSSNDPATTAAYWEEDQAQARNGIHIVDKDGVDRYYSLSYESKANINIGSDATAGSIINAFRNPFKIMEAHRAVSYAVAHGVGELEWFTFEGNKYKYRSVQGFAGPHEGEMTCVLWKVLSGKLAATAFDPADHSVSIGGNRFDALISVALFHGIATQVSPSKWTSGLVFTEDENGDYECYMQREQEELVITPNGDIPVDQKFNFEETYKHVGETITNKEAYARNYDNDALMIPDTNANSQGGGLHTYVGKRNYFRGTSAPAGYKSVRGFRRGSYAYNSPVLSPLYVYAAYAPSYTLTYIGFGTCCRIVE